MASSHRYAEDAAELEAFERTLKNRIHGIQGVSQDSKASSAGLGAELKELQSNFDSYLRMAHKADRKREREAQLIKQENEDLKLEVLMMKRQGGPRLPMELLTLIAQFLAGTNSFGTLANLNVASKGLLRETKPILNETMLMDARGYWWFRKLHPNSKLEDIIQHTTASQREAWQQANRQVLSDFLNIPLHMHGDPPLPVILRDIYLEKRGSITGPISAKEEYWIGTSCGYLEDYPNIHFEIENVVTMCHTLKHLHSMLPPLDVRAKETAERSLPGPDHLRYAVDTQDPPVLSYRLNGSIDCLIPFFDTVEELILRNLDTEDLLIKCVDINCFDRKQYVAIMKPISDVFRRLWTAGARTTFQLMVSHRVNLPSEELHEDSVWTNTYLSPISEGDFVVSTTFDSLNGDGGEIEYPEATEDFDLPVSLMDES
ncbi:hypothetical protein QFC19_001542 [Naganishia cerealis]|uniref:Uncharacterized protein n=1 Tax=Naganishia cerealis TaxID=610337 RepID=A0ACC2WIM0_9TREE|nr:hypothetical protein QFC19_001542 [Naganishia cerealis]